MQQQMKKKTISNPTLNEKDTFFNDYNKLVLIIF
jgi:hypothetical protein